MAAKGSWTKSLFVGLWNVINFSRKLFLNLIFIVIAIAIIAAMSGGEKELVVNKGSALHLKLVGNLVIEKEGVDPFEEFMQEAFNEQPDNPEVLVRDIVKVLENARDDRRIKALILDLQSLGGGGLDKLRVIADAIEDFKTSEKPVYAIGDYFSQNQYYLAAHADHIYLNPMGGIMFEGYGRFGMYFKDMLEKLKVTTHVFRVGTYKSAVEPVLRNDMSEAAKEANLAWLDIYWEQYKNDVAAARDINPDNFDETLDTLLEKFNNADGDFAQYALDYGWVDALKTREEIRRELVELVGSDNNSMGVNLTSLNTYSKVINPPMPEIVNNNDKVAVVVAKGTILNGNQKAGTIGGDSTARLLRKARMDDTVKAVVLHVDSGGGSSFASEIIRQEVLNLQEAGKPVVAMMGTYAASGGYWISMDTDRIIASPSTVTGSIGVFGMFMTYENTLSSYLGVHTDGVASTELAGLSPVRALDPKYGQLFQRSVEGTYSQFINFVAQARGMTPEAVDEIAQGRVWIGEQALELGLVDELANLDRAVEVAAELAEVEKYDVTYVQRDLSSQEKFWKEFFGQAFVWTAKAVFADTQSPLLDAVKTAISEFDSLQSLNDPYGVYIYCLECRI